MWRRTTLHKRNIIQAVTSVLAAALLLTACGTPAAGPTEPAALTPYWTFTPSPSATLAMGSLPGETSLPSATPFTYIIQAGDTMGALADRFGVPVNALIAANPNISPNAMPIGASLLIPTDRNNPTGESTPTPVPFAITQIDCYPTLDDGTWCFLLARNDSTEALENVSAQITLVSAGGELLASQAAIAPLNLIPPNSALPLTAFFPSTAGVDSTPHIQVLAATSLAANDSRYLSAALVNPVTEVAANGRTAAIHGEVSLPAGSSPAKTVWVAAVAYDGAGRVVGFRRWEGGGLEAGGSLAFRMTVASLGAPLTRVELFVEARP
jgi:LysM repeat protein